MMEWVYIKNLKDYIDKEVELRGWVRRKRSSGKIMFIEFRDGTGFVQVVVEKLQSGTKTLRKLTN